MLSELPTYQQEGSINKVLFFSSLERLPIRPVGAILTLSRLTF